jgi:hypothetical protein
VAAIAAAAVAAFFIKSRRGTPPGDVFADCSIRSYFNSVAMNSLQLLTKSTGNKFAVNSFGFRISGIFRAPIGLMRLIEGRVFPIVGGGSCFLGSASLHPKNGG